MDTYIFPTPENVAVPSILMCSGRKFYRLHELIEEYEEMGPSKRLTSSSIPDGLVENESKIFIAHPDAIITVTSGSYSQLVIDLEDRYLLDPDRAYDSDYEWDGNLDNVPDWMLDVALALDQAEDRTDLIKEYGIEFMMGIVGWSYLHRIEYVMRDDENGLPTKYAHLEGYVKPVRVSYEEDNITEPML